MTLHRLLFPNCHRENRIAELEAENARLAAELKDEINWNRRIADKMINAGLTKSGQYGIPAREYVEPAPVVVDKQKRVDEKATREERIRVREQELTMIYAQRGHNVPPDIVRKTAEDHIDYLDNDDRVEL